MSNFTIALVIAGVSDLIDWLGIGMIPIAGDILDLATVALLYRYIGVYAVGGLAETIPLFDIFPTYIGLVLAWRFTHKGAGAA